jgi:Xaa-Pro aminopeptidase
MIEKFLRREDSKRYSISQHELERRWKAVRQSMATEGLDYLVIQSQQRFVGGYFRWFTDLPGTNFNITGIFPLDDDMTIISHGPSEPASPTSPAQWALRGVRERINTPAWPNVWWEDSWDPGKAAEVIMRNKPKTVGLVGMGNMSAAFYENLQKGLPGVSVINATELVDKVRMIKSEEELQLHRQAAYLHEESYELAKKAIRPGRIASEVIAEICYAQALAGSEEQQIDLIFNQPGESVYAQCNWGNTYIRRTLREGDVINLLIESSIAGGYWYDLRRFLCFGSVPKELQAAMEIAKEARHIMELNCKPGLLPSVALDASDEFLKSKGCPVEHRVGGHGQGLDLVERPVFHRGEPAKLEKGMVVSLHPTAETEHALACLSDTYVITAAGAVPLYSNLYDDDEITVLT